MRVLVSLALLLNLATVGRGDPAVAAFLEHCSGCHTIGEGELAGPDLLPSTQWPRNDLRAAVQRMEANVGPLPPGHIDAITDLLKAPDLKARLYAATMEKAAARPQGSAQQGERLYFGTASLSNGGSPCFACHTTRGRGGSLAMDLTTVHTRLGEPALLAATTAPGFPLMKTIYGKHPVTEEEAAHLVAFLSSAAVGVPVGARPQAEKPLVVHGAAGGIALAVFGAVFFVFRSRRAGVRARMLDQSRRRT